MNIQEHKKGQIYHGAINVDLHKMIRKRMDKTTFEMGDVIYTMNDDKVHVTEYLLDATKRRLPHHLQNHEIINITKSEGRFIGMTNYEL